MQLLKNLYVHYAWISIMKKQKSKQNVKVVFVKTFEYYHHKFNFDNFSCPVKLWKNLKLKFRSKIHHGYLQSVVWKALYDFNPIDGGSFFRGCSRIGGTKKAHLPKIYLTYPTMMALGTVSQRRSLPTEKPKIYKSRDTPPYPQKNQNYINHVTHHLSSAEISIISPKISKFCYAKKYI